MAKDKSIKKDSGLSNEAQEALEKLKGKSVDSSGKPLKKRKPKPKPKIGSGEQHKRSDVSITRNNKDKVGSPMNTRHVLPGNYEHLIGKEAAEVIAKRRKQGKN